METPICDFIREYRERGTVRMHMPGHKGAVLTGPEADDITEIAGADELYHARGIIRRSEENAAKLFGTARTVYSAEGSSLCIRAMLMLACIRAAEKGIPRRLLAGRNAHRTLMTAAAMLDVDVDWIYPGPEEGVLSCRITPEKLEEEMKGKRYMAVYVTSPDYLGNRTDIRELSAVCRRHDVPLLVDNAHGAYLRFLQDDQHPVAQGADLVCDSAHKTLLCLTGAAYLHISRNAPAEWITQADQAMAFFASTSPSWLILQSLDRMNALLAGDWRERLWETSGRTQQLADKLRRAGWQLAGDEPMKLTFAPKSRGLTGYDLADLLRENGVECEFSDPDYTVLMPSPALTEKDWERTEKALADIIARGAIPDVPPAYPVPEKVCSIREAMLSPRETIPVGRAENRVLADPCTGCPPAVPLLMAGEWISREAIRCFRYYGVDMCTVMR